MLELAIAEAYRPRATPKAAPSQPAPPRPVSFATNPHAKASNFSLRLRPTSALSRSASTSSQPRSVRSFITRRKKPDSVLSDRTIVPEDAVRSDSVLSPPEEVSETPHKEAMPSQTAPVETLDDLFQEPSTITGDLPELPPNVALPPQEELGEFDLILQTAIDDLQTPRTMEQQALTTSTLQQIAHVADITACIATSWSEYWSMLTHAVKLLISVIPPGNISANNALVRSLAQVARRWNEAQTLSQSCSTAELPCIAGRALDELVSQSKTVDKSVGEVFAQWLYQFCAGSQGQTSLRILSLDPSSTVFSSLTSALLAVQDLDIHLSTLSSLFDTSFPQPSSDRLHLSTLPPSAIGTASQDIDILILGALRIDEYGAVQCTAGALAATIYARALSPEASIVAVGRIDSIGHGVEQGQEVAAIGGAIEWVPARFVHVYITELGILGSKKVSRAAKQASELERHILCEDVG